jgi:hypothetical protein
MPLTIINFEIRFLLQKQITKQKTFQKIIVQTKKENI